MQRASPLATLLMGAALAATACQPADQPVTERTAAVDTAAVMAAIDSLRESFEQAVADGDWERLQSLAAEDLVMVLPGGATWDTLTTASAGPYPAGAEKEIRPIEVRSLDEDWVYELGTSRVTWTPEGADQERTVRYSFLALHHRTPDGWKVYREVASSRLPPGMSE